VNHQRRTDLLTIEIALMNLAYHRDIKFEAYLASFPEFGKLTQEANSIEVSISALSNKRHELLESRKSKKPISIGAGISALSETLLGRSIIPAFDLANHVKDKIENDLIGIEKELAATRQRSHAANRRLEDFLNHAKANYLVSIINTSEPASSDAEGPYQGATKPVTVRRKIRTNRPTKENKTVEIFTSDAPSNTEDSLHAPDLRPSATDSDLLSDYRAKNARIEAEILAHESIATTLGCSDSDVENHRKILEELTHKKEGIERSLAKVEAKISGQLSVNDLGIKTLCIDGSNLCNQTTPKKYVGLALLKSIVPELVKRYEGRLQELSATQLLN
jgi:hypothetical protein